MNKNTSFLKRDISEVEIRTWLGKSPAARLRDNQYQEIAARLNRRQWPGQSIAAYPPPGPFDDDPDRWWDFKATPAAAKQLQASMPALLRHWQSLTWAPETEDGFPTLVSLGQTLEKALPYIEWPFGKYEPVIGRKPPKAWHRPSVSIALLIIKALSEAGHINPGISRASIVTRFVREAMMRMGYVRAITKSAIAAHLTRHDKKYGLRPDSIVRLTTKRRHPV